MGDFAIIEIMHHDADRAGWIVNGVSFVGNVTRRGPEFIELPETATQAEIEAAVIALYSSP